METTPLELRRLGNQEVNYDNVMQRGSVSSRVVMARLAIYSEKLAPLYLRSTYNRGGTLNGCAKFRSLLPTSIGVHKSRTNVAQFVIHGSFQYIKFVYYTPM